MAEKTDMENGSGKKHRKRAKKKARGAWLFGMAATILLAVGVFLCGSPYMEAAREKIAAGVEDTLEYLRDNDRTGSVRRRHLYLKEEEKSREIIKRNLGKDVMPPPDPE